MFERKRFLQEMDFKTASLPNVGQLESPVTSHGTGVKISFVSNTEKACFYCKKPGHLIADCPVRIRKHQSKADALVKTSEPMLLSQMEQQGVPKQRMA